MADAVLTQTLMDGPKWAILKFTNVSDRTRESTVAKVTPETLSGAPTRVAVKKVQYSTTGMSVNLLWDAGTDALITALPADVSDCIEYEQEVWPNDVAANSSDILFTTVGHTNGDTYSITLTIRKKYD